MIKICILNYGLGNIKSLSNALNKIGYQSEYFSENQKIHYDLIFIPGVGSFSKASDLIYYFKINEFINKSVLRGAKIFGICLGMQLMFNRGFENKETKGLGLINGEVKKIKNSKILPIIGWKETYFNNKNFTQFNNTKFYYCHSYAAQKVNKKNFLSITYQEDKKTYLSGVINSNLIGTQFHPEKSGENGLEFLKVSIEKFFF